MLALTFQVGPDRMALDIRRVREVVPRVRLTPTVGGPPGSAGAFVYRGRVVPVLDLYRLTDVGECPYQLSSRIILVPYPAGSDHLVGLLASQVADVQDIPVEATAEPVGTPFGLGPSVADGTTILRILDPDRLFTTAGFEPTPGSRT
jgi:chemotaxis-related protein WspB